MKAISYFFSAFFVMGFLLASNVHAAPKSEDQATICHVPPGNPANAHTITVGVSAVKAHIAHGDHEGACVVSADNCDKCAYSHEDYLMAESSCVSSCGFLVK